MLQPDQIEEMYAGEVPKRMKQLKAVFVPERSKAGKHLYWAKGMQSWILVTPAKHRGVVRLGFFPMERCPCEDM